MNEELILFYCQALFSHVLHHGELTILFMMDIWVVSTFHYEKQSSHNIMYKFLYKHMLLAVERLDHMEGVHLTF